MSSPESSTAPVDCAYANLVFEYGRSLDIGEPLPAGTMRDCGTCAAAAILRPATREPEKLVAVPADVDGTPSDGFCLVAKSEPQIEAAAAERLLGALAEVAEESAGTKHATSESTGPICKADETPDQLAASVAGGGISFCQVKAWVPTGEDGQNRLGKCGRTFQWEAGENGSYHVIAGGARCAKAAGMAAVIKTQGPSPYL